MKKNKPTTGGLIVTSHNPITGVSYFKCQDLATKTIVIKQFFYDLRGSDNILSFCGISSFLSYALINGMHDIDVYCANSTAVTWAKKKKCNTRCSSYQTEALIRQSEAILLANNFTDNIELWNSPKWGSPKDNINGIIRPDWMRPTNSENGEDAPF